MHPVSTEAQAPSRKDVRAFEDRIYYYLRYSLGRKREGASRENIYLALAYAIKHDLLDRMIETVERYERNDAKRIYAIWGSTNSCGRPSGNSATSWTTS